MKIHSKWLALTLCLCYTGGAWGLTPLEIAEKKVFDGIKQFATDYKKPAAVKKTLEDQLTAIRKDMREAAGLLKTACLAEATPALKLTFAQNYTTKYTNHNKTIDLNKPEEPESLLKRTLSQWYKFESDYLQAVADKKPTKALTDTAMHQFYLPNITFIDKNNRLTDALNAITSFETAKRAKEALLQTKEAMKALATHYLEYYKNLKKTTSQEAFKKMLLEQNLNIENLYRKAVNKIALDAINNNKDSKYIDEQIEKNELIKEKLTEIEAKIKKYNPETIAETKIPDFVDAYLQVNSKTTGDIAKDKLKQAIDAMRQVALDQFNAKIKTSPAHPEEIAQLFKKQIEQNIADAKKRYEQKKSSLQEFMIEKLKNDIQLAYAAGLEAYGKTGKKHGQDAVNKVLNEKQAEFTAVINKKSIPPVITKTTTTTPPEITSPETEKLLTNLATALSNISGSQGRQKTAGTLVFETIVASSELFKKPTDADLKTRLKEAIGATKTNPAALADLRTYPTKLLAEFNEAVATPATESTIHFFVLSQILQVIDKADSAVFDTVAKTDLDTLMKKAQETGATQQQPGILQRALNHAKKLFEKS